MGEIIRHNQASFTAGELSPRLYGRVDLKFYQNGLYNCTNMVPFEQGSITRRTGTNYVATAKSGTDNTLLVPFSFNTIQSYILEFGNLYMRVYRNRGQVIASGTTPYEMVTPWVQTDVPLLKFTQSADFLYVFHPKYPPQQITRTADNAWSIAPIVFQDGPYLNENSIAATTLSPSVLTVGSSTTITASATTGINSGAGFLATDVGRLIRIFNGTTAIWGNATITAVGSTTSVTATVNSAFGAVTATPNWSLGAWSATTGYPSVVTLFGERLYAANTTTQPDTLWGSVVGSFTNFAPTDTSGTVADDSAFTFTLNSDQVDAIYWMVATRVLFLGTSGSEWSVSGGSFGSTAPITPTNVVVLRQTNYGARPQGQAQRINNKVLFATRTGRRFFKAEYQFSSDSYIANNLTQYANHITGIDGINYFDVKNEPDTEVWACRVNGGLITLTYNPDEGVVGWAEHILGGSFNGGIAQTRSVAVIPSPDLSIDDVWLLVKRTVNGQTVQFVEYIGNDYLPVNLIPDEAYFVDAGLTYNGYYASSVTLTSAALGATTITAANAVFASTDVGKVFKDGKGGLATITAFTSSTILVATVTSVLSGTSYAQNAWSLGAINFSGVLHLENTICSVLGDGADLPQVTISNTGTFTLDNYYSRVAVGLPYVSQIITLPVEEQLPMTQQGMFRRVVRVHIRYYNSVGLTFYADGQGQQPQVVDFRTGSQNVGMAIPLYQGILTRNPPSGYDKDGRLVVQSPSTLPMTILCITQEVDLGG